MTAIVILVAFLAGAMTGIAVLLRLGMATEDSRKPLACEPPTRSALATRYVVGLYVLTPCRVNPADRVAHRTGAGQRQLPPATAPRGPPAVLRHRRVLPPVPRTPDGPGRPRHPPRGAQPRRDLRQAGIQKRRGVRDRAQPAQAPP